MYKYIYDGPVMVFNQLVTDRWVGETLAVTKRKARSNLMYQCKQALGLSGSAAVIMPGTIRERLKLGRCTYKPVPKVLCLSLIHI